MRLRIIGALLCVVAFGCSGSTGRSAGPRADALVLGDSLLYEARHAILDGVHGRKVVMHAVPGGAPCDLLPALGADLARWRPRLVVLETAGNRFTACATAAGALGSPGFARRYAKDFRTILDRSRAAGARVVVLDPPPVVGTDAPVNRGLVAMARTWRADAAGRSGVEFVTGPRDAVSDHGRFVLTMPCRPDETTRPECRAGQIAVRDPYFRLHFCPRTYRDAADLRRGCRVYSSGAIRFGDAIAAVIDRAVPAR
jgi:hypothetical protein